MSGGDRTCDGPTEPIPGVEAGLPQRLRSSYPGDPGGGGVGRPADRGGAAEDLRHDLSSVGGGGQSHAIGYYRTTLLFWAIARLWRSRAAPGLAATRPSEMAIERRKASSAPGPCRTPRLLSSSACFR